jgi:glycosyltransferase involved in cell wall biosynthesis
MMIFDARWDGPHGIGRFAGELRRRFPEFVCASLTGRPSDPLDPWVLYRYLKRVAPSLFFSPGYNPPLDQPCPFVFCVHDLNHLHIRENSSMLKRAYYRHIVRPAIHRARKVITGSEFSRAQICEWSGAKPSQVVAVGYGVSAAFAFDGVRHAEGNHPYFLGVGNQKSHKNTFRIVQAFASAFSDTDYMLLCTGDARLDVQREVQRLGIDKQVRFVGAVTDEHLARLYRGALALVFVSLYEGFGLPIIEAMACGAPVLTATVTAMPEVAGNAAIMVDPLDVEAIAEGMRRLAGNSTLRQDLRAQGLKRSKLFSWEQTSLKVRNVIAACE